MTKETLHQRLVSECASAGYLVADRGSEFTIAVMHQRTGGDTYTLQWAVAAGAAGPVRVRKLLDDAWRPTKAPTVAGILAAIEAAEIEDTRRAWPTMPEYQAIGMVMP